MGVTTYKGRTRRALLHKQNSVYWVGIGRTTPWTDEQAPPDPQPGLAALEEPILYVKPTKVTLCRVVSSGEDITHLGTKYAFVSDEEAINQSARFMYIFARFDPTAGQPYENFRQIALFSNLVPGPGHEGDSWLAPENVADEGLLEFIAHDIVTVMTSARLEVVEALLEFR